MKPNGNKCHFLVAIEKSVSINIDGSNVRSNVHITSLCKKASQKLHALARIVNYMDLPKREILMKEFITSQLLILH